MIIRKTPKYKKENSWDIEYVKFNWKIFKPYLSSFLPLVENLTNTIPTLIPLFSEEYEGFKKFYQKPINAIK